MGVPIFTAHFHFRGHQSDRGHQILGLCESVQASDIGSKPDGIFQNNSTKGKVESLDWFKGKSTGNHGFYHQI